jgi:hypothetical protein
MTFKTVYWNRLALSVKDLVMEQMGLHSGQVVTDAQGWKIIELDSTAFVAEMDVLRTSRAPNIPYCTELKASLARIRRESD